MNFEKLSKEILSAEDVKNINDSWMMLINKEYEMFYNKNKYIIDDMLLVDSYLDFLDFLDFIKPKELNKTIFVCAWMEKNEKSIGIGGYEQNIQNKVISYLTNKVDSIEFLNAITNEKIFTDFDGEDNFRDYLIKINVQLAAQDMQFILFFNDIYVQCTYSLFLLNIKLANQITKEWDDANIELIVL